MNIHNILVKLRIFHKKLGFWRWLVYLALLPFLPFLVGGILIFFIYKKVPNENIKWILITVVALFSFSIGIDSLTKSINPADSTVVTTAPIIENKLPDESETKTTIEDTYLVIRVVDGDTIELEDGTKVRYIGVNTPETVDPNSSVECYGKEASIENKRLVEGKKVRLEKDVSDTDKYGRLLRYVWVEDVFVNDYLVKEGYANVSTYPPDIKYQDTFLKSEKYARDLGKGLWGSCKSNSIVNEKPTVSYAVINSKPAAMPTSGCKYACSSPDRDCSDFSTHDEAQEFFDCCNFTATYDPMRLDSTGVGDGIACESLP